MPGHGSQIGLTAELEPVLGDDDTPIIQAARAGERPARGLRLPARVGPLPHHRSHRADQPQRVGSGPAALDPRPHGHRSHARRGRAVRRLAPRREFRGLGQQSAGAVDLGPRRALPRARGARGAGHVRALLALRPGRAAGRDARPLGRGREHRDASGRGLLLSAREWPGRAVRRSWLGLSQRRDGLGARPAQPPAASPTRRAPWRATWCGACGSTRPRRPRSSASTGSGCAVIPRAATRW